VVTWDPAQQARVWDDRGGLVAPFTPDQPPVFAAGVVGPRLLAVTGGPFRALALTSAKVGDDALFIPTDKTPTGVSLDAGGKYVAAVAGEARVWELPGGREVLRLPGRAGQFSRAVFDPAGPRLGFQLSTFAVPGGTEMTAARPFHPNESAYDFAFQPGGRLVAVAWNTLVTVWDSTTGKVVRELRPTAGDGSKRILWPGCVAFSPDGRRLAVGAGCDSSGSETVRSPLLVYDVGTWELVRRVDGFLDGVWSVAWSPDGRRLATGSGVYKSGGFGEVRVWDTDAWAPVAQLRGHTDCVWSVAFSPAGRRLASAAGRYFNSNKRAGELIVWDLEAGQPLLTRRSPELKVMGVAFSGDGKWFAAAEEYGIRVWNLKPGQEVAGSAADRPAVAAR
jgi:WD40 repeat protein